jgi:putative endonuclease
MNKDWRVYLLQCLDGSLYCGATKDVPRRMLAHMNGTGSRYVRARGYGKLYKVSPPMTKSKALRLEARVKKMAREKKAAAVSQGG